MTKFGFWTLLFPMGQVSIKFYYFSQKQRLNSIRKTKKKILGSIAWSKYHHPKSQKIDFHAVHACIFKCQLVMFSFSEIRYSYVTFKVKIPNGYPCPFIKMLFKVAHLIKTCCKKIPVKSVLESQNLHLPSENIKPIGSLCCF